MRDEDDGHWRCSACGKPTRAPVSDLPRSLRTAIARAVADAGGDEDDARDLAEVWRRVLRDCHRRAGAIRTAARLTHCRCTDGGDPGRNGRCSRCGSRSTTRGAA